MKTLLILRHAKSSWKDGDAPDHDRLLNKRGRREAPQVGGMLSERQLVPQLIITSTALRAVATAELVAEACGYTEAPRQIAQLYAAAPETYIEALSRLDDRFDLVLVVGHNPGLEILVEALTGSPQRMPTAGLAQIEAPISSWRELSLDTECELLGFWRPKELD